MGEKEQGKENGRWINHNEEEIRKIIGKIMKVLGKHGIEGYKQMVEMAVLNSIQWHNMKVSKKKDEAEEEGKGIGNI